MVRGSRLLFLSFNSIVVVCFRVCVTILIAAGEVLGDVFEVSRIRREDYEFHKGKSEYEDILQCNNLPSSATPRGHQTPAAFLIMASGLDKVGTRYQNNLCKLVFSVLKFLFVFPQKTPMQHGVDSTAPLPYSHIDIAGSSGPFPGVPTGAPVITMATKYILSEEV